MRKEHSSVRGYIKAHEVQGTRFQRLLRLIKFPFVYVIWGEHRL